MNLSLTLPLPYSDHDPMLPGPNPSLILTTYQVNVRQDRIFVMR